MRRAPTALLSMTAFIAPLAACGTDGGDDPVTVTTARETTTSLEPTLDASTTDTPNTDT